MLRFGLGLVAIVLTLSSASAHTGLADTSGFAHGFLHPLNGIDHVLAMVAVGVYAALLGGRALWLVPLAFVAMMAAGGALGIAGIPVPFAEIGIALSVLVLGLAIAFRLRIPALAAIAVVGLFAIFHGYAHGAEMPETASGFAYGVGFVVATVLLHALGIGLGLALAVLGEQRGRRVAQIAGALATFAGVALLAGFI